jgi:predicted MFS family arabinose efflux permease
VLGGILTEYAGMAVGLAVLATVAAARTRAAPGSAAVALVSGYRLSYWIATGIAVCALAVVVLLLRGARSTSSARRTRRTAG